MNLLTRGVKNAFRGGVRPAAVILILAISMGLALAMLLANQAVKDKLEDVKQSVGTAITVNPAGSESGQGGGEPLKSADIEKLAGLENVEEVSASLGLMVTTESDEEESGGMMGMRLRSASGVEPGETNLESPVDPGTLGQRRQGVDSSSDGEMPEIKLPIQLNGISGSLDQEGKAINLTDGRLLQDGDTYSALVGADLAEKNSLSIGDTFKAYEKTFTVVGIYDSGTEFGNAGIYIPLVTAQKIGDLEGEATAAVVVANSIDNVESVTQAVKDTLGEDNADVATADQNAEVAVESLESVEKVSIIGFIVALGAAGVIIFLTMMMIVRERKREIGVLKAIGGGNGTIIGQFIIEAIVLVAISAVVGFGIAALSSNSIANALVSDTTSSQSEEAQTGQQGQGPGGPKMAGPGMNTFSQGDLGSATDLVGNVTTNVSGAMLGYGLLAAVGIAIIGSAIPAWFITKVRPAEVLRGE